MNEKLKETLLSILPITLMVLLIHFSSVATLDSTLLTRFLLGALCMMIGFPLFLQGVDMSIELMGEHMSGALVKSNKMSIVIIGGFILGFLVNAAEPDVHIFSRQFADLTMEGLSHWIFVLIMSAGFGTMVAFGLLRIIRNVKMRFFAAAVLLLMLVLLMFTAEEFIGVAFDTYGATTGAIATPFLLALAIGVSSKTRRSTEEAAESFGILGIGSVGAVLAILVQGILMKGKPIAPPPDAAAMSADALNHGQFFLKNLVETVKEVSLGLSPILISYAIAAMFWIKPKKRELRRIVLGAIVTFLGLVVFLSGVYFGFLEASKDLGMQLAQTGRMWIPLTVGGLFGLVTVFAEPSVHILNAQIEEETMGSIRKRTVLWTLAIGVALAVTLSVLRILIPEFKIVHMLIPTLIAAIALCFLVPDIFIGIALDAGGVASGTMAAAFILPYAQGLAEHTEGASQLIDGFGIIAFIAFVPILSLLALGLIYRIKAGKSANAKDN